METIVTIGRARSIWVVVCVRISARDSSSLGDFGYPDA